MAEWTITGSTENATIDNTGKVTFDNNYAGTYTATCRDNGHCGQFIITRSGDNCDDPPTPVGGNITFEINESDGVDGYGLTSSDLRFNSGKDGYRIHESSSTVGKLEIVPTNISIIAKELGVSESEIGNCSDFAATCAYYNPDGRTNVMWNFTSPGEKEIFKRAWSCTAENSNWQVNTTSQDCSGRTFAYTLNLTLVNKSNTYYVPYEGYFKMKVNGVDTYAYSRFCSDTDSIYHSPHYHYGRTSDANQCSNYLLAPNASVTLFCVTDRSFAGVTAADITSPNVFIANLVNTVDPNPNLPIQNCSNFHLERGGFNNIVVKNT